MRNVQDFSSIKTKLNSIYSQDMKKQSEQINKKLELRLKAIKETRKSRFCQMSQPQFDFQQLSKSIQGLRRENNQSQILA